MSEETRSSVPKTPPALLRYFVAFAFITYGFAKLTGAQFTVLESELDQPMRDVPGFWLTWYYFGYSAVYGSLIALVQIVGGLLLTFRRTTLLGTCTLFAVATNIVLVDIFFGVDRSGTIAAIVLWTCLLAMLWWYREPLLRAFWPAPSPEARGGTGRAIVRWVVRAGMVAVAAGFTYWVANYNNRVPTPLDGVWDVRQVHGDPGEQPLPTRIYFERNRAFLAVFRYADGSRWHHFEVDPAERSIQLWTDWLRKDRELFTGTYALAGDRLELSGRFAGSPEPVTLSLVRRGTDPGAGADETSVAEETDADDAS